MGNHRQELLLHSHALLQVFDESQPAQQDIKP